MFLNRGNTVIALLILDFTSASDPSCSSMMLSSCVEVSTSPKASLPRLTELVFPMLYLRILLLSFCMLRSTAAETAATLTVFTCICSCVWDRTARSSTKSKSSCRMSAVHCISCFPLRCRDLHNSNRPPFIV
ncbi:unnamed protein product [Schistosoma guineensis]|nr:unnamed protein product [Schistosoma guineensis]